MNEEAPKQEKIMNEQIPIPEDEEIFQKIREGKYEITDTSKLTTLTDEIADILIKEAGGYVYLNSLRSVTDSVAEILARHKGFIYLSSIQSLSDVAAEHLSKHEGDLDLGSLEDFSDTAAKYLAESGDAYLDGDNQKRIEKFMSKENIDKQHSGI
jgi:hypothetical protein